MILSLYELYAQAMAVGVNPVPAASTFQLRPRPSSLVMDTGYLHGPGRSYVMAAAMPRAPLPDRVRP